MESLYYTTAQVRKLFGWKSTSTVQRKRASGFLPEPDIKGKPNRWLKSSIDAIVSNDRPDPPASTER